MKTKYIIIGLIIILLVLYFIQNKEHLDATECRGFDCTIEGQRCPKGSPGATDSDYVCTNKKWVAVPSAAPNLSAEAIQNIAKVYADTANTANFNNIKVGGKINGNLTGSVMSSDGVWGLYLHSDRNIIVKKNDNGATHWDLFGYQDAVSNKIDSKLITPNTARYIRVGNNVPSSIPRKDYWTIQEIEVYTKDGTNIAKNKPISITAGSQLDNWSAANAVNGEAPRADNNFYHGNTGANELEIDLGQEYHISQIVLFNRYHDGLSDRMDNTSIQLLDKDKKRNRIIFTGNWLHAYSKEYTL